MNGLNNRSYYYASIVNSNTVVLRISVHFVCIAISTSLFSRRKSTRITVQSTHFLSGRTQLKHSNEHKDDHSADICQEIPPLIPAGDR